MRGILVVVNYNQAGEIAEFLESARKHFPIEHTIVVDDGSVDGSDRLAEQAGFQVIRHGGNRGIGAAIRTGLLHGKSRGYDWALISSSNGKIRPEEFSRVYSPVAEGRADYVTGNRYMKGGGSPGLPLFRRIAIPAFSLCASVFLWRFFSDITCGFRAYTLKILDDPEIDVRQEWLDRYELEYYLHYKAVRTKRYRILQVPVTIPYSHIAKGRESKIRPWVDWWSMVRPFVLLGTKLRK